MLGLRLDEPLTLDGLGAVVDRASLGRLVERRLVEWAGGGIRLTPRGRCSAARSRPSCSPDRRRSGAVRVDRAHAGATRHDRLASRGLRARSGCQTRADTID